MTRQAIAATNKNKAIGSGIPRPEIDCTTDEKFIIFGGTETIKTADKQILAMKSINLRTLCWGISLVSNSANCQPLNRSYKEAWRT